MPASSIEDRWTDGRRTHTLCAGAPIIDSFEKLAGEVVPCVQAPVVLYKLFLGHFILLLDGRIVGIGVQHDNTVKASMSDAQSNAATAKRAHHAHAV